MNNNVLFATLLLSASAALTAGDALWNKDNNLGAWQSKANATVVYNDQVLKVTDIKKDHQIVSPVIKLNAADYNAVSITYRAKELKRSSGQLFFAGSNGKFSGMNYWRIPALRGDFKWHTLTLTGKNLRTPGSWEKCGTVTRLRLDAFDAEGGYLEISEIKFFKQADSDLKKKVNDHAAKWKLPPLKLAKKVLDESEWPQLTAGYKEIKPTVIPGNYFQGKMLKSPLDGSSESKSFKLRRTVKLKSKPVAAYLQFTADDSARAFINGEYVGRIGNWRKLLQCNVTDKLHANSNVWAFEYSNAVSNGGVVGELFVQYADGTFERFHTDENFVGVATADPNWHRLDFAVAKPLKLAMLPPAPALPWGVVLPYCDYSMPQKVLSAVISDPTPRAGQKVRISYTLQGKKPAGALPISIMLQRNKSILWEENLQLGENCIRSGAGNSWQIDFDYTLPEYISGGEVTLSLQSIMLFFRESAAPPIKFNLRSQDKIAGYATVPHVKVKKINGKPQIMLNGKPFYLVWGGVARNRRPDKLPRHSDGPLNAVTVYSDHHSWYPDLNKFDPANFDYCAELYRRHNPDAYFIWDIQLYPPHKWAKKYPDEMCQDNTGAINQDGRLCYSLTSRQALEDLRETVAKAITYLENSPYANRIIGYRICGGHTIEWLGWDPKPGRMVDFSPAAQKGFKDFAEKHYPELKDTTVPTLEERCQLDNGELLWDAQKHLKVAAYNDFYSSATANMIIELAREARKHLKSPKLIGSYYGYTMTLNGSGKGQMRAHYALKKLLDAQCVDFLMSPQAYSLRKIGDVSMDMKPFASMQNSNVIPIIEDDTRTHNGRFLNDIYQCVNEKQSIDIMRRNMGIALCRLQPSYYYALSLGTDFDFPAMKNEIADVRIIGEHIINKARRQAPVALVVSEESIKASPMLMKGFGCSNGYVTQRYDKNGTPKKVAMGGVAIYGESLTNNYNRYARMGTASDYILAEDLADMQDDKYQVYIFINTFNYDQKFLEKIRKLQQRNCTLLWVYAPGYNFEHKGSLKNMFALTGFEFTKSPTALLPQITLNNQRKMGTPSRRIAPIFQVKPAAGVTVLGKYEDGSVGYAMRKTGKAKSIFCGAYQFDMPFLLELLKNSGVHIYTESTDILEVNSNLLMLHARFGGKKEIQLPTRTTVLDIYNRKIIGKNINKFSFEAPLHSTFMFYLGEDAEILLKKLQSVQ